ncbi:MAG: hypothetical protein IJS46_03715, partial [Kiritimatiellae bacterium]|nr:hypothetical protein [Kiritimatiellia bacterium]
MTPGEIRVFGFGGAGCRVVDALSGAVGDGLGTWVADTDFATLSSLANVPKVCRHLIGDSTFGNGSGGQTAAVRDASLAEIEVFRSALDGVCVAIAVAALAGGTGAGALPVFLEAARERNVRTVVFAVKPFRMEGVECLRRAASAAQFLATLGDVRFMPSNDDLAAAAGPGATLGEALEEASRRLVAGLSFFWRLCAEPGFLHLDAEALLSIVGEGRGEAEFSVAEASGETRLDTALSALWDGPGLGLRRRAAKARAALVGVIGGSDLKLSEVGAVSHSFEAAFPASFPLRLSTVSAPQFDNVFGIVAVLFNSWQSAEREEARAAALAGA